MQGLWTPKKVWCPSWQDNPNPTDPRDQWGLWFMGMGEGTQWRSRHSRALRSSPSGLPLQEPMWVCVTKPCSTLRVILSDFNDGIGRLFSLTGCTAVSQEVPSALFLTEDENSKPGVLAPWIQIQLSTEKPISVQHADIHCFLKF